MKIVVLVKQTPDTAELPSVGAESVRSGDVTATMVINPWDEYATEEAIQLGERFGVDTVALTLGPPSATDALKHAIAMGIDAAKLVDSSELDSADLWLTADVLAAAVQAEGDVTIVLAGKQSVDGNGGCVSVGVAGRLGWAHLTNVVEIREHEDGQLTAVRIVEGARETVQVKTPVVISVAKEINEPRYPNFMGIRKASRAEIPTVALSDLNMAAAASRTRWTNIRKPEERKTAVQMIEGASAAAKAEALADALMAEKVI